MDPIKRTLLLYVTDAAAPSTNIRPRFKDPLMRRTYLERTVIKLYKKALFLSEE
jgi:hypothetical protein